MDYLSILSQLLPFKMLNISKLAFVIIATNIQGTVRYEKAGPKVDGPAFPTNIKNLHHQPRTGYSGGFQQYEDAGSACSGDEYAFHHFGSAC